jgi:hypothetical protein
MMPPISRQHQKAVRVAMLRNCGSNWRIGELVYVHRCQWETNIAYRNKKYIAWLFASTATACHFEDAQPIPSNAASMFRETRFVTLVLTITTSVASKLPERCRSQRAAFQGFKKPEFLHKRGLL